jgi:hypothetical protein
MAFSVAVVVVGSTATKLVGAGTNAAAAQNVKIRNTHATDALVIGPAGVTAATGFKILAGETLDIGNLDPGDVVYAIRGASADITAHLLIK